MPEEGWELWLDWHRSDFPAMKWKSGRLKRIEATTLAMFVSQAGATVV